MTEIPGNKSAFRIIFATIVTAVCCSVLYAKVNFNEKYFFSPEPGSNALGFIGDLRYFIALPIFPLVFWLPDICGFLNRRIKGLESSLARALYVSIIFSLFSYIAYLTTIPDFPYLFYFLGFSVAYGIVELIWSMPFHPDYLDRQDLTDDRKAEMLNFGDNKFWRAFNVLWVVFVALVVSGFVSWQLAPLPPEPPNSTLPVLELNRYRLWNRTMLIATLVLSLIPAAILIIVNLINRTNYLHKKLGDLYSTKLEIIKNDNADRKSSLDI